MKIGVFDSGIGGEAIAAEIRKSFPAEDVLVVNDRKNLPYGEKSQKEVIVLTKSAIEPLLNADCEVIVIACNTATALAIESLRILYPNQKFIGIEPMIKTASQLTKSGTVAVCATPGTLSSQRYLNLKKRYAKGVKIIEPDCRDWAYLIENSQLNMGEIHAIVDTVCGQGADIIVLGCTHYHWIKNSIEDYSAGRATVIEPTEAITKRIFELLKS